MAKRMKPNGFARPVNDEARLRKRGRCRQATVQAVRPRLRRRAAPAVAAQGARQVRRPGRRSRRTIRTTCTTRGRGGAGLTTARTTTSARPPSPLSRRIPSPTLAHFATSSLDERGELLARVAHGKKRKRREALLHFGLRDRAPHLGVQPIEERLGRARRARRSRSSRPPRTPGSPARRSSARPERTASARATRCRARAACPP